MVWKIRYDFLRWTSCPSSLKFVIDRAGYKKERRATAWFSPYFRVRRGDRVEASVKLRGEEITGELSPHIVGAAWKYEYAPRGTFDWIEMIVEAIAHTTGDARFDITLYPDVGVNKAWIDDVRVWVNDVLVIKEDFSNWKPYIGGFGVGILAYIHTKKVPIAVGAGIVGSLIGAAIGTRSSKLKERRIKTEIAHLPAR